MNRNDVIRVNMKCMFYGTYNISKLKVDFYLTLMTLNRIAGYCASRSRESYHGRQTKNIR